METIPTVRMADFEKGDFVSEQQACVVSDGLASCTRLRQWTPEHLAATCGDVRVVVAVSFGTSWRPSPSQHKRPYRLAQIPVRDAVRWIRSAKPGDREFYVPQEPIEKFPALVKDVTFGRPHAGTRVNIWFGTANTVSPLHHDRDSNFFGQVYGEKRFILYPPDQVKTLYPMKGNSQTSAIDPLRPDLEAYPRYAEARPIIVTVKAGEVLFLPGYWWHHVTSLSVSISVNQWWRSDMRKWCNRTAAIKMTQNYMRDGWAEMLSLEDMQLDDLLAFAEQAAAVDQTMAALALSVVLDYYDRWPDHDTTTPPVEADVRQGVERLRQAVLDDNVYDIGRDTIVALARRVRHESVLGGFARAAAGRTPAVV